MSLGSVEPPRHSASAKCVVTFGHSQRVHLLKVWRHVQIYPNLHPALLKVSAKVSLAVRLPNRVRHRCLVVYRTVRLHNRTATALQQLDGVFEQLLEAVVIHIEVIRRDALLVSRLRLPTGSAAVPDARACYPSAAWGCQTRCCSDRHNRQAYGSKATSFRGCRARRSRVGVGGCGVSARWCGSLRVS